MLYSKGLKGNIGSVKASCRKLRPTPLPPTPDTTNLIRVLFSTCGYLRTVHSLPMLPSKPCFTGRVLAHLRKHVILLWWEPSIFVLLLVTRKMVLPPEPLTFSLSDIPAVAWSLSPFKDSSTHGVDLGSSRSCGEPLVSTHRRNHKREH